MSRPIFRPRRATTCTPRKAEKIQRKARWRQGTVDLEFFRRELAGRLDGNPLRPSGVITREIVEDLYELAAEMGQLGLFERAWAEIEKERRG